MIHHLARAFFVRSQTPADTTSGQTSATVVPLPTKLTATNPSSIRRPVPVRHLRITSDPSDARRTVITGRIAEVCAALDRLVMEQEASPA